MSDDDPRFEPPATPPSVAEVWDEAAEGYEAYFVPRFEPWLRDAIAALGAPSPLVSEGSIAVPCCGPGRELELLASALPDRTIVGVDVSSKMCAHARKRCRAFANVRVEHADANALSSHWGGSAGAVLSCFGLQLSEHPDQTLADWTQCLAPAGRLVVVFWPPHVESEGPFALLRSLLEAELGPRDATWQERLVESVQTRGAEIIDDRPITHEMTHPSAATFFDAFAHSGPGRAIAMQHGFDLMERLRTVFVQRAPEGSFVHEPTARLIAAQRST
jgi:ubiquinone/menaquinone biosynthesis C-methylase UbiE